MREGGCYSFLESAYPKQRREERSGELGSPKEGVSGLGKGRTRRRGPIAHTPPPPTAHRCPHSSQQAEAKERWQKGKEGKKEREEIQLIPQAL